MSSYCIADVHGNLDTLKEMLKKINFKYDGSDTLFIIGDMVDWGDRSIDTLLFCKELDETYNFITVLIGNHEFMMIEHIKGGRAEAGQYFEFTGWGKNGGVETIDQYSKIEKSIQDSIRKWLSNLKYFVKDLMVGGRKFYITHSSPYDEIFISPYNSALEQMVWKRVVEYDNPIKRIFKDEETILVHGHTITKKYRCMNKDGKCEVYFDLSNQTIAIDCGCKVLGRKTYGRLACLRLDDLEVFYIDKEDTYE